MAFCTYAAEYFMAFELYGMLAGNVSPMTSENVKPAYGGEEWAFLKKVVNPIYEVVAQEAVRSKKAKSKHSQWRNYDDLNEYFWPVDCFRLGWPMCADADFFRRPVDPLPGERNEESRPRRMPFAGLGSPSRLITQIGEVCNREKWRTFLFLRF